MFPLGRIVCLTEETVETLYLLGQQDRIVGISGYVVQLAGVLAFYRLAVAPTAQGATIA
jgi:hypothetical protein